MTALQSMESFNHWQKIVTAFPRSFSAWSKALLFNSAAAKAISLAVLLAATLQSRAIIFYGSGDAEKNTTAPTGTLAGSGWDLQGNWGVFQGTPIGPRHFVTAFHLGGAVGDVFTFRGVNYVTVSAHPDPASDLQIWEIAGTFPEWAELYDGPDETGSDLVVFGRGATRGDEVRVNGALRGWKWGPWDFRLRWGRNRVSSLVNDVSHPGSSEPGLVAANFESNATADEAHLGVGDSGGAIFIKQGATWRLAGINYSVTGPYNTSNLGDGFNGAIFDDGGLYKKSAGVWTLSVDLPTAQSGAFYATRIKPRLSWIHSVLASPPTPFLTEAADLAGLYTAVPGAVVDATAKTVRFTPSAGTHFYQLASGSSLTITASELEGEALVLRYE